MRRASRRTARFFYRYGFAAILLGVWMALRGDRFRISRREVGVLALLSVLFAVSSLTFFESFRVMDSGLVCTLLFVYPMMVAGIMVIFFKERLSWAMGSAILLALTGIRLLCKSGDGGVTAQGLILIFVSSLSYALSIVVVNRARLRLSAVKLTFYVMLFCLPMVLVHEWVSGQPLPQPLTSPRLALWAIMLAMVPTVLSLVLMTVAVRLVGSTPTAVMGALEPLTAVAIGLTVFGEAFTPRLALGIILILGAVILITLSKKSA